MPEITCGIRAVEGDTAEAFTLSGHPDRHALAAMVTAEPITETAALTTTAGACLTEITTCRGSYYEAVITDLVTDDCLDDLDYALAARGCPRWRDAVVDKASARRPHPFFPGSTTIQYLIIHPEAS